MAFIMGEKVALVTGAASGLGRCISKALLQNVAKAVAILDINEESGKEVENELRKEFGENSCVFIKTDVSEEKQMRAAFDLTVKTFKHLDIVVNNAATLADTDWKKCVNINLGGCMCGTVLAMNEYLPKYKSGEEGVILNISSIAGVVPLGVCPIYSATKHGIIGLTRNYGEMKHYERSNVKVIAVCPGHMSTPMLMQPQQGSFNEDYVKAFNVTDDDFPMQKPEFVAEHLPDIIDKSASGSIWVIENSEAPYRVDYPNLRKYVPKAKA